MTAPALRGTSNRTPDPTGLPQGDPHGESSALHPDVLAYVPQLVGEVTPRRLRDLQRQYDIAMRKREEREERAVESAPSVWRTVGNRSTPADPQGDHIARRLSAA